MREDNPALRAFARRMRREPTVAEQTLWRVVRNRRLAGFKFRRQVPFGPYILDCYCASARLAVEADGDTHATDDGKARDAERRACWCCGSGTSNWPTTKTRRPSASPTRARREPNN
jgi:very-short-patch-repair endonuclease